MVTETPNSELVDASPDGSRQLSLFVCDIADAVLKDLHPHMEHPFYSLSKKPDREVRRYTHGTQWIEVRPSAKGSATIYDKDLLIFAISNLIAAMNRGEQPAKKVRLNSYDYLEFTKRGHGGRDYEALVDSLDRLDGTRFATNITTGGEEQRTTFGLVDRTTVTRKLDSNGHPTGRILSVEITLSDWVFNAITHKEVLTLSPNYFELRKPLERRIYELARKHCGNQPTWKCSIDILHHKSGSQGPVKQFKYLLKAMMHSDLLPDYHTKVDGDDVIFLNRTSCELVEGRIGSLKAETYEEAKTILPGADIYTVEADCRRWWRKKKIKIISPDQLFLSFCKTQAENRNKP